MSGQDVIGRLVHAARQRGGQRLELAAGLPPLLVIAEGPLRAGKVSLAASDREGRLERVLPRRAPESLSGLAARESA